MVFNRSIRLLLAIPALLLATNGCKDDGGGNETDEETGESGNEEDPDTSESSTSSGSGSSTTTDDDESSSSTSSGTSSSTTSSTSTSTTATTSSTTDDDTTGSSSTTDDTTGDTTDSDTGGDTTLVSLIETLCGWEFQCCSTGELAYRLGPFTGDAAECTDRFAQALNNNENLNTDSPRADLLYYLGYYINLDRSVPVPAAIDACIAQWEAQGCNQFSDADRCVPITGEDECELDKLFDGLQEPGEPCNNFVPDVDGVECVEGSRCEEVTANNRFECVAKAQLDEFCDNDDSCDRGLYCDLTEGTCALRGDVGDDCAFDDPEEPTEGTESQPCLEHLRCNAEATTCVEYCTDDWVCLSDVECAEGRSCVPVEITADFDIKTCKAPGTTANDLCDTADDCVATRYCSDAGTCLSDIAEGNNCNASAECETGTYCNVTCTLFTALGETCTIDEECNPGTSLGCITTEEGMVTECRGALIATGERCDPAENAGDSWCASGLCEEPDSVNNPGIFRCVAGLGDGGDCTSNGCSSQFYCDTNASVPTCKPKLDSGGDCSDDEDLQCLNGMCTDEEIWGDLYCTDAPPATEDEAVTCDGA